MFIAKVKKKLNSTGQRNLLQHALQIIESRKEDSLKFFKFLVLSKQFLLTSRYYKIYHLVLKRHGQSESELNVCFTSKDPLAFVKSGSFIMSIDELKKCVRLLNPKYLGIVIGTDMNAFLDGALPNLNAIMNAFTNVPNIDSFKQIVRIGNGKIAVNFPSFFNQSTCPSLLAEFGSRLSHLSCNSSFLLDDDSVLSKLNLENYKNTDIVSMNKLGHLLRALKTTEMECNIFNINSTDNALSGLDPTNCNRTIKELKLSFDLCPKEVIVEILKNLPKVCPNLQKLKVFINLTGGFTTSEFTSEAVVQKVLVQHKMYKQIKYDFKGLNFFKLNFSSSTLCGPQQYNDGWKTALLKYDEFKDARAIIFNEMGFITRELQIKEVDGQTFHGKFTVGVMSFGG